MNNEKRLWITSVGLCLALLMASPAKADMYSFDFMSSDHSYEVVGKFTTGALSTLTNGYGSSTLGYDITSISGTVIGQYGGTINSMIGGSGIMVTNYGIGFIYDNVAYPTSAPSLDIGGMLFTAGSNNAVWNLWANSAAGPNNYELYSWTAAGGVVGGGNSVVELGNVNVSPVPEPEIFAMLLAGLVPLGLAVRRKKRKERAAA